MPQRIHFSVVHASSTEKGYNMKQLESHHHQVKGWLSSRFCIYPQEIILNLKEKIRVRLVQILAHEYMIPSKVDFYVGLTAPDHMTKSHHKEYKLLGYTLFGDNATTERKLRELRSINVDAVGQYLRLVLDKNYVNKYNLFNQVGLIAVNVIGDTKFTEDVESEDPRVANKKVIDEFLLLQSKFKDNEGNAVDPALIEAAERDGHIAPTDDLAFDMFQDPEIATLIRKFETKRNEATKVRQFTLTKKLEKAIDNLKRAGEVLSQYDVEKRRAVEKEDYEFARQKKMQIDDYRRKIYKDIELEDLCRHCVVDFWYEKYSWDQVVNEYTPSRDIPNRPPSHPFLRNPSLEREEMPFVPQRMEPFVPFMYEPIIDDRPLPTLASKDPDPIVLPSGANEDTSINVASVSEDGSQQAGGTPFSADSGVDSHTTDVVTSQMIEKIRKQSGDAMDVFGQEMVIKIHSKNWSLRENGFNSLASYLEQMNEGLNKEELRHTLQASVNLSLRGVKDKVLAVFTITLHLLSVLLDSWIPKHKLNTAHTVEIILPELMARIGDTNQRLKCAAIEFIVAMATYKEVHDLKLVPHQCVTPFKPTVQTKVALARLEIVKKLVEKLELDAKSGLTVSNTTTFAKQAMEHTQATVREAAVNLIHELYKLKGSEVIGHLPAQDDPKVLANKPIYGKLFKGLSKFVVSQIKAKALANSTMPEENDHNDPTVQVGGGGGMELEGTSDQIKITTEFVSSGEDDDDVDFSTMQHALANIKIKRASIDSLASQDIPAVAGKTTPFISGTASTSVSRRPSYHSPRRKSSPTAPSLILPPDPSPYPSRLSTRTPFAPSAAGTIQLGSDYAIDNQYVFCGEKDDVFQSQMEMDEHFMGLCPMLMPCSSCKQVVEISKLSDHLLTECQYHNKFARCPRCHQVKKKNVIEKHQTCSAKVMLMNILPDTMTRCPLCNVTFPDTEEQWQIHLLGNYGCKASVRRQKALQRVDKRVTPISMKASTPAVRSKLIAALPQLSQSKAKKISRIPRPVKKLTYSI